jgi:hypothetical protein
MLRLLSCRVIAVAQREIITWKKVAAEAGGSANRIMDLENAVTQRDKVISTLQSQVKGLSKVCWVIFTMPSVSCPIKVIFCCGVDCVVNNLSLPS